MPRKPNRYPMPLYERVIKRWVSATFWLGIFLIGFGAAAWFMLPQYQEWEIYMLLGTGALALLITLILFLLRKGAYLQLYPGYLRIVTPFMRVKVGYKRILRSYTAEVSSLFPAKKMRGMRKEIIAPFMKHTAIVITLNAYPRSPWLLHTVLSPFFFIPKDKSPHFILLVDNWLDFSTDLESSRAAAIQYTPPQQQTPLVMVSDRAKPAPSKKRKKGLLSGLGDDHKKR
jgi:hypothetical protein